MYLGEIILFLIYTDLVLFQVSLAHYYEGVH